MTDVASKTAEVGAVPIAGGNGRGEEPVTVLAEGDSLQGRLSIKGNAHVLGMFQGEIDCDGELLIGKDAEVAADIRTRNVVLAGLVRGNVVATGRLRIMSSGRLEGDARVGSLVVQEGGVHHGVIRVHPEGVPAEPEPVAPAHEPAAAAASAPKVTVSVDRVKKLWGEFF